MNYRRSCWNWVSDPYFSGIPAAGVASGMGHRDGPRRGRGPPYREGHPQLPMRDLALWRALTANRPQEADELVRVRILPVMPF